MTATNADLQNATILTGLRTILTGLRTRSHYKVIKHIKHILSKHISLNIIDKYIDVETYLQLTWNKMYKRSYLYSKTCHRISWKLLTIKWTGNVTFRWIHCVINFCCWSIIWRSSMGHICLYVTKYIFDESDKSILKPVSSATETS